MFGTVHNRYNLFCYVYILLLMVFEKSLTHLTVDPLFIKLYCVYENTVVKTNLTI